MADKIAELTSTELILGEIETVLTQYAIELKQSGLVDDVVSKLVVFRREELESSMLRSRNLRFWAGGYNSDLDDYVQWLNPFLDIGYLMENVVDEESIIVDIAATTRAIEDLYRLKRFKAGYAVSLADGRSDQMKQYDEDHNIHQLAGKIQNEELQSELRTAILKSNPSGADLIMSRSMGGVNLFGHLSRRQLLELLDYFVSLLSDKGFFVAEISMWFILRYKKVRQRLGDFDSATDQEVIKSIINELELRYPGTKVEMGAKLYYILKITKL